MREGRREGGRRVEKKQEPCFDITEFVILVPIQ